MSPYRQDTVALYMGYREERWLRTAVAIVVAVYGGYQASAAIAGSAYGTAVGWVTVSGFASGAVSTGTFRGGVQGALTSLAFFGVGQGLGAAGDVHWTLEAAAHGVTDGVISELQGGKFGHGFLSSGLNKAVHSQFPTDMNLYLGGTISAMVGGTVSELTGGKFANGAITAAMAYAYNQLLTRGASSAAMEARARSQQAIQHANAYAAGCTTDQVVGASLTVSELAVPGLGCYNNGCSVLLVPQVVRAGLLSPKACDALMGLSNYFDNIPNDPES